MKVVKNVCYGGFGLSYVALKRLSEITGKTTEECYENYMWGGDKIRAAPELVQIVEELGSDAAGSFAELEIVEIPDDVKWYISEYDGVETIEEIHRSW